MKKLLVAILLLCHINNCLAQLPCDYCDLKINFDDDTVGICSSTFNNDTLFLFNQYSQIYIDTTLSHNLWQIGRPQKTVFDSAYSYPNAIVTDTIHPCVPNDTSIFYYSTFDSLDWKLSFYYRLDIDSGDIVLMEGLSDSGWINISEDTLPPFNHYYFPNGVPDFTHSTNGWDSVVFYPVHAKYRFIYITDTSTVPRDGWIIDNFEQNIAYEGSPLITLANSFNAYPVPASQQITITYSLTLQANAHLNLYDMAGRLAATWPVIQANTIVPLSALSPGVYLCELNNGNDKIYRRIIVTK